LQDQVSHNKAQARQKVTPNVIPTPEASKW
jgi:hypothetical protein